MALSHPHRVILVVPAARLAAFRTWVRNNLDAAGDTWFQPVPGLAGFHWCGAALTDEQCRQVWERLANLASLTPPANWAGMTRAEKKLWAVTNLAALKAATGLTVRVGDSEGAWPDPAVAAAGAN